MVQLIAPLYIILFPVLLVSFGSSINVVSLNKYENSNNQPLRKSKLDAQNFAFAVEPPRYQRGVKPLISDDIIKQANLDENLLELHIPLDVASPVPDDFEMLAKPEGLIKTMNYMYRTTPRGLIKDENLVTDNIDHDIDNIEMQGGTQSINNLSKSDMETLNKIKHETSSIKPSQIASLVTAIKAKTSTLYKSIQTAQKAILKTKSLPLSVAKINLKDSLFVELLAVFSPADWSRAVDSDIITNNTSINSNTSIFSNPTTTMTTLIKPSNILSNMFDEQPKENAQNQDNLQKNVFLTGIIDMDNNK